MVARKPTPVPDFRELLHGGYPANVANLTLCLDWVFEDLTDVERATFFESLRHFWCFECGGRQPDDGPRCRCWDDS